MRNGLLLFCLTVLTGCASTSAANPDSDERYISDRLETTLVALSKKAVEAKQVMLAHQAAMTRLNVDAQQLAPIGETPKGMDKPIPLTNRFYGDAKEPIKLIAQLTNYEFQIKGTFDDTEVLWVKLHNEYTRSAFELLNDIANQIDSRGIDIHVWETPNKKHLGVIVLEAKR